MNILITGINGFIGSNFTKKWSKDHILYGLDINETIQDGVKQIYSWSQLSEIPPIEAIIHLAGKAHDTKNKSLAQTYFDINTELTKKIFDYFIQSEAQTFIFFSSVKAVADSVPNDVLAEEVTPRPIGPYGESKIKAENYILSKQGIVDSLQKRFFIVRPCMIHGPGNKGNLNLLYNIVKKGIPWPLGAYENKRSFCSIDNISFVVEQFIEKKTIQSGIYNVGDDESVATNELIQLISDSIGKKSHIWKLSKGMINMMTNISNLLHMPLTKERLQKLTENYIVSNKKVKQAIGVERMPIGAKEGLKKTIDSFQE